MSRQIYILVFFSICLSFLPQLVSGPLFTGEPFASSGIMGQRSPPLLQDSENWFSRGSSFWGYGLWGIQLLSHFLTLLIVNVLFGRFFAKAIVQVESTPLKIFGRGLIYLFGVPFLVIYSIGTLLGLPFGLLLLFVYVLSLWLGDCIAALLLCYFLNSGNERSWNFWTLVLLSLGMVVVLELLLFFPVLGIPLYMVILAYTFGTLGEMILEASKFRLGQVRSYHE